MNKQQPRAPALIRLHADESNSLCALYASLSELERAADTLSVRLRGVPNGKRDLALTRSVLSRLIDRILATIPAEKLVSMRKNMQYMHYRVYAVQPASVPPEEVFIQAPDLAVLTSYAHRYACIACDRDCNHCELGKALDHVLIQCRASNESWTWIDPTKDYDGDVK